MKENWFRKEKNKMVLVVAKSGKTYYIREMSKTGVQVKKNSENKYMLCLDDRTEPIAIYNSWQKANESMEKITESYGKDEKFAVIEPND